ncbi:hypothetical protein [Sulfidibacter corallicola]|uniref:Uncharacterized protein n=1 Tax=Sulfidibacter corallicola TaxID=2818388 RepID=A0A8A4TPC7_SULCO|nr:hypothetical protein [Sulfidibacter corallicola]QTD51403.1 hypothetical protein J3U87_02945 [Sulfidibacter corallicola]
MSQDLSSELYQALVLNAIQPLPPTSFLGIEPPNDHLVLHHLISTHLVGRESIEKLLNDFSERAQNLKSQMEKDDRDKCDHSLMKKSNMRESRELTLKNTLVPFPCVFAAGPKQGKYHSFQSPSLEAGGRG